MKPRVLTWHVHGSYLYYLTQADLDFYLPVQEGRFLGRTTGYPWGSNVHEVPADEVRGLKLDAVLYQTRQNYLTDQFELLSEAQRRLPRVYLEHDPPQGDPTGTRHVVDDPEVLLVHVTHFNDLMWDPGRTPTRVVEHGVLVPEGARYTGELARGLVVVNDLKRRGRRLGADLFRRARAEMPLDLYGINMQELGGVASLSVSELWERGGRYRLFLNPIRYTSLGLAVCEAMAVGLPVVGLATTEMATAIENGRSGFVSTDFDRVLAFAKDLLADPGEARRLGAGAREAARERFGIERFCREWEAVFA